jgi:hypothetical protein
MEGGSIWKGREMKEREREREREKKKPRKVVSCSREASIGRGVVEH